MGEKHFELTDETKEIYGHTVYRIRATKDSRWAKEGQLGGFVESVDNLNDNAWVADNANVFENAKVYGEAKVFGSAQVYGTARVSGNAWVYGQAMVSGKSSVYEEAAVFEGAIVSGHAEVFGSAKICGDAKVYGEAKVFGNDAVLGPAEIVGDAEIQTISDYVVFKNFWSSGRYLTWTRSNDKWQVGCFYGAGKDLIERAYRDSEVSGKNYEAIVNYVENVVKPQFNKKEK